jgi:hypothetical protein
VGGFLAGGVLVLLTFAAFTVVWRLEEIALHRLTRSALARVRIVGVGLTAIGILAGWPIPNTNGTDDLAVLASAVLSVTLLLVVGQVLAALALMFAQWFTRQYGSTQRGHKT